MQKWTCAIATILLAQMALAKGVAVRDAFARPTVAGIQQGGAFMQLTNTDPTDHVLIGASVSKKVAAYTELHTHINENGVMKMRQVKDGIVLPAGQTVALQAGGYHIMFFDLKQPLTAGQSFNLKLKFKNGQSKNVKVQVKKMGDTHSHHHEHQHEPHGEHHHSH
ncbi:copper chaperone PCu(A)C [Alysiella filiformis]|uniref:Copper(I)-binding protein n=1 Tax=Alysiella filiformis DSM 16848 TaxID=1120981 RepID=A0A286E8U5_9NEIS|nr:copper chaperone PCu(A)C [Alysiella filiformis]QMT32122.1 copper chaperone PCu(A)C [Alysiella filiformis]UBQ56963.1 copper chaperone PCu(A)C [Alysiella filiformis DSM 16848]SOD67326.1 hypothetical protein SAMN02746062_00885 [Alysiella filiformis DSM 16848]